MRRVLVVMVLLGVIFPGIIFPQAPESQRASATTFSEEEKAVAKKELEKVGEMFGIKKPSAEQPAPPQTQKKEDVTMADVADRALTMMGSAVGNIASTIQKVAPEVWRIMVRQQYAVAISTLASPLLYMCLMGIYAVIVKRYWKKYPDNDRYFEGDNGPTQKGFRGLLTTLIPGILALISATVLVCQIGTVFPMIINPEYYAVRDLLQMLLK